LLPVSAASLRDELNEAEVRAALERAFGKLRADYEESGGWRYLGPRDADEQWGWIGPYAWSEADFTYKYARLLEEEFPRAVRLEMPIKRADALRPRSGARGLEAATTPVHRHRRREPRITRRLGRHPRRRRSGIQSKAA
jgi:hypothetical protein